MALRGMSCIFPVPDIQRTTAYYRDVLGFRAREYLDCAEPHVCLYRDDAELLLLETSAARVTPIRELYGYGYDAYVYATELEKLQQHLIARGTTVARPLALTDYHNREFVVEDPDGRWVAFGLKEDPA